MRLVARERVAGAKIYYCISLYERGLPQARNLLLRLVVQKSGHGMAANQLVRLVAQQRAAKGKSTGAFSSPREGGQTRKSTVHFVV